MNRSRPVEYTNVRITCSRLSILSVSNRALVMTDNGQEYQELPNPKFLDGGGRKTVQFFYDFLPGGQVVQCTSLETENLSLLPVYSLVIVVLTTSAGMFFFKKKELK